MGRRRGELITDAIIETSVSIKEHFPCYGARCDQRHLDVPIDINPGSRNAVEYSFLSFFLVHCFLTIFSGRVVPSN